MIRNFQSDKFKELERRIGAGDDIDRLFLEVFEITQPRRRHRLSVDEMDTDEVLDLESVPFSDYSFKPANQIYLNAKSKENIP
jgi:hypothetical protein